MQLYMMFQVRDPDGDLCTYYPQLTADINVLAKFVEKKESDKKSIIRVFKVPSMEEIDVSLIKRIVEGL